MGYRKAKLIPITCNDERTLVLRQQYALRMLALFQSGRRIINIDESWLNQSRFIRKVWVPTRAQATFTDKQIEPRISLITAFDTNGKLWWALRDAGILAKVYIEIRPIRFFLHVYIKVLRGNAWPWPSWLRQSRSRLADMTLNITIAANGVWDT